VISSLIPVRKELSKVVMKWLREEVPETKIRQSPTNLGRNDPARVIWRIRKVADDLRPIFYSFSQDNIKRSVEPLIEK
jgi:hypothetical protein